MNLDEFFFGEDPKLELRRLYRVYFDIARRQKQINEAFQAEKEEVLELIRQEKEAATLAGRAASSL